MGEYGVGLWIAGPVWESRSTPPDAPRAGEKRVWSDYRVMPRFDSLCAPFSPCSIPNFTSAPDGGRAATAASSGLRARQIASIRLARIVGWWLRRTDGQGVGFRNMCSPPSLAARRCLQLVRMGSRYVPLGTRLGMGDTWDRGSNMAKTYGIEPGGRPFAAIASFLTGRGHGRAKARTARGRMGTKADCAALPGNVSAEQLVLRV